MMRKTPTFFAAFAAALFWNGAARADVASDFYDALFATVDGIEANDGDTKTYAVTSGCADGRYGQDCKTAEELCAGVDGGLAAEIAAAREKLAAATAARDSAVAAIEKKKKGSLALDIVGIAGGVTATAGGALGIAKSKSIFDSLNATAQSMQDCRDAIGLWRRQYASFDNYCARNYDAVKDYGEYKSVEYARMPIAESNEKCTAGFLPDDYYAIQSDLKTSGASSGVALAGGVGTMATSTGAIAAKETEDKKNWRIASTVSSGVAAVAGVVSTVVVNKIKKTLLDARDRNAKCLDALDAIQI